MATRSAPREVLRGHLHFQAHEQSVPGRPIGILVTLNVETRENTTYGLRSLHFLAIIDMHATKNVLASCTEEAEDIQSGYGGHDSGPQLAFGWC